mmetsp:Transcript_89167/g.236985  ORF Transcript_89167/g.236985 Transcript_89167/m.236985 type:complete len:518 (-) Transcript_89167:64-1617(-)
MRGIPENGPHLLLLRPLGAPSQVQSLRHVSLASSLPPCRGAPHGPLSAWRLVQGGVVAAASLRWSRRWWRRRAFARRAQARGRELPAVEPPPLEETLQQAYAAGAQVLGGADATPATSSAPRWTIEADEATANGSAYYSRFRIDPLPAEQGRPVGNVLRRTLMRQDFFRTHAVVALRVHRRSFTAKGSKLTVLPATRALHEFASVPGMKESMIDVIHNVQHLAVARLPGPDGRELPLRAMAAEHGDKVETWRWASRSCGPCAVQARDLDIVDSSTHYEVPLTLAEPAHHLCQLTAQAMLELEIEVACCSEVEWDESPAFQTYRRRLLNEGWLQVPPLFSPVRKVNFSVTRSAVAPESQDEAVQLEVWTRVSERPATMVRAAAASLLTAIRARSEGGGNGNGAAEGGDQAPPPSRPPAPPEPPQPTGEGAAAEGTTELWEQLYDTMPQPEVGSLGMAAQGPAPSQQPVSLGSIGGSGFDDLVDMAMGTSEASLQAAYGKEADEMDASLDARKLGFTPP